MPDSANIRILFVGDMHLGRLAAGLPDDLRADVDSGPAGAWKRVVDAALKHEVQAVALAGDLVHQDNAAFGAYGPLREGVGRLAAAGIPVCAVAGNHDAATLPHLAGQIGGFTLLGANGTWSAMDVGDTGVRIVGWSFPREHHRQSPCETPPPPATADAVTFGLLHGDLNKTRSAYAPVTGAELRAAGYDRWFLGHEHVPGDAATGEPFYLGSLTPLDASETGLHGPVLVRIDRAGDISTARLPLAPVRWEKLDVRCDDANEPGGALRPLILESIVARYDEIAAEQPDLRAMGFDLYLTGEVEDPDHWDRALRALDAGDLQQDRESVRIFVRKMESRLRARRDLSGLAGGDDPAGLLARRIMALESPGAAVPGLPDSAAEAERLVTVARDRLESTDRRSQFAGRAWTDLEFAEEEIRTAVRDDLARVARRTLDHLLASKGGDDAAR